MKNSNDPRVQQFLEEAQTAAPEKHAILQAARTAVFKRAPATTERFIYGGIMFALADDFGGIFASKHHVSFEFGQGYLFKDPDKRLEGGGKFRRHLKLRNIEDVTSKDLAYFISQAVENLEKA